MLKQVRRANSYATLSRENKGGSNLKDRYRQYLAAQGKALRELDKSDKRMAKSARRALSVSLVE